MRFSVWPNPTQSFAEMRQIAEHAERTHDAALRCDAEREIALAEAHLDFLEYEMLRGKYVPARRRADLLRHLLAHVVAPGGRLLVGVSNEVQGRDETQDALRAWGFAVAGRSARPHRDPRLRYEVLWIDA